MFKTEEEVMVAYEVVEGDMAEIRDGIRAAKSIAKMMPDDRVIAELTDKEVKSLTRTLEMLATVRSTLSWILGKRSLVGLGLDARISEWSRDET